MKARKKDFKRDNKLKLAYKDMGFYPNDIRYGECAGKPMGDFIGSVPLSEKRRWDIYLLFNLFLSQPIHQATYEKNETTGKLEMVVYPPLIEELEKRGYDPKTIYFEIEKQGSNYTHDGIISYATSWGDKKTTLFEEFQKKTTALELISIMGLDVGWFKEQLKEGMTYEEYNFSNPTGKYHLNEKHFNLLKEELL